MSNKAYITIKEERKLNSNLEPVEQKMHKEVYINTDEISCWIGRIDTIEDLHELIDPNNLQEVLNCTLSEDELNIINACMSFSNGKYYLEEQEFIMKES